MDIYTTQFTGITKKVGKVMGSYYSGMMNNEFGYGELRHHGILGQKWGVRRFQNADGSLTAAGRERYYGKDGRKDDERVSKAVRKDIMRLAKENSLESRKQIEKIPEIQEAAKRLEKLTKAFKEKTEEREKILDKIPVRLDPDHSDWVYKSNDPLAKAYRKVDKEYYKAFDAREKAKKREAFQLLGINFFKIKKDDMFNFTYGDYLSTLLGTVSYNN
jgi:hypothetical protein